VPRIGTPAACSPAASFSGGLPAQLDDDPREIPLLGFSADDLEHVLMRQRLEIEAVTGVRVGRTPSPDYS
jgi:hypothetical protein